MPGLTPSFYFRIWLSANLSLCVKRFLVNLFLLYLFQDFSILPCPLSWDALMLILSCVSRESEKWSERTLSSWRWFFPSMQVAQITFSRLKFFPARCTMHKLNSSLLRTLILSCTHGRHWWIVIVEENNACSYSFKNLCHHFAAVWIINRNYTSVIMLASVRIILSKYLLSFRHLRILWLLHTSVCVCVCGMHQVLLSCKQILL